MNAARQAADLDKLDRLIRQARFALGSAMLAKDEQRIARAREEMEKLLADYSDAYGKYKRRVEFIAFDRKGGFACLAR